MGAALAAAFALVATVAPRPAVAAVTEPNGIVVPAESSDPSEGPSLQEFFDEQGVEIDAIDDAAAEPGAFFPACGGVVSARLVLRVSGALAGIAWYNVPNDATSAPAAVHDLVQSSTPLDATVSVNLTSDPRYIGGSIAFVLMKDGARVYYSEYQRNAYCSACSMPGHWKMMLVYPTQESASYYLAFEDWEGANASDWLGNDGDFNDQAFLVDGIRTTPCSGTGGAGGGGANGGAAGGGGVTNGGAAGGGGTASGNGGGAGATGDGGTGQGGSPSGGGPATGGTSSEEGGAGPSSGGTNARGGSGTGGNDPGGEAGEPTTTGGTSFGPVIGDATRDARAVPANVGDESGCGCRLERSHRRGSTSLPAVAGVALLLWARRRRFMFSKSRRPSSR
jgi:hypothetical protein